MSENKPNFVIDPAKIGASAPSGFRTRSERNPTMQMSVRMREDIYMRFRDLAERERRTNGEMLEILLENYLTSPAIGGR